MGAGGKMFYYWEGMYFPNRDAGGPQILKAFRSLPLSLTCNSGREASRDANPVQTLVSDFQPVEPRGVKFLFKLLGLQCVVTAACMD